MSAHWTMVEVWASEGHRTEPGKPGPGLRWKCSCGRLGPLISLNVGEKAARTKAERGGGMHMQRSNT